VAAGRGSGRSGVGAAFGYPPRWTAFFSFPLMAAVGLMCARLGMVSVRGLATIIRRRSSRPILWEACALLPVANVNIGANLGGMAEVSEMLTGVKASLQVVAEAEGWRGSLEGAPRLARRFYAVVAVSMPVGFILNFVGLNAVAMLFWSAVVNGVLAALLIVLVVLITIDPTVMGNRVSSPLPRWLGWATAVIMTTATVVCSRVSVLGPHSALSHRPPRRAGGPSAIAMSSPDMVHFPYGLYRLLGLTEPQRFRGNPPTRYKATSTIRTVPTTPRPPPAPHLEYP
jgi:Mn2+/Fe2+ NRAMP family transporter